MKLELETNDFNQYLAATDVIDYDDINILTLAEHLGKSADNKIDLAKTVYEYVRYKISLIHLILMAISLLAKHLMF